jgi:hypothetical protein
MSIARKRLQVGFNWRDSFVRMAQRMAGKVVSIRPPGHNREIPAAGSQTS